MENEKNSTGKLRSYTLWYIQGNLAPLFKTFEIVGTLHDAMVEGRRHCEAMGIKFLRVRPFMVDLRHQEALKAKNPAYDPDVYVKNGED
jgi:hypothetical protein